LKLNRSGQTTFEYIVLLTVIFLSLKVLLGLLGPLIEQYNSELGPMIEDRFFPQDFHQLKIGR
tara:strand:- start:1066 stop:1254 length:189 start_codon:yes stop_codon:yes gene_type:complete